MFAELAELDGLEGVPALLRLVRQGQGSHEVFSALSLLAPDEILPAVQASRQRYGHLKQFSIG